MPSRPVCFVFPAAIFLIGASFLPAQTRDSAPRDPRSTATRSAKGPLPDPALLDGSALEAEKRPENGMLGEFEMPGDENAKSDRVGQSSPPPPAGGGGSQALPDPTKSGGGGPSSPSADQAAQGGGAAPNQASAQPQAGGAGGKASGAQAAPGGTAEGMQVGEMSGSGGESGQNAPAPSSKPQQVALGDSAMQIKPQGGAAPGVVGAQQLPQGKDAPQQYDGKTPSGGKQSGGHGNQGVEKGRVMPAGI